MAQNTTTLNEIANNIRNSLRGGRSNQDDIISLEQIKDLVKNYRALFLRREYRTMTDNLRPFEQDLGVIAVSSVDSNETSGNLSGNTLKKTNKALPAVIRFPNFEGITYVSNVDQVGEPIPVIDAQRAAWQQYSEFTGDMAYAIYLNGFLYIINDVTIQNVRVRGVFEDPEDVYNFVNDGLDFYTGDEDFPITKDMAARISEMVIKQEGNMLLQTPNDTENDTLQDTNS